MRARTLRTAVTIATAVAVAVLADGTRDTAAALPPGNTVAQWNKIAEDTVVGSGAFQAEGFIYTAYASTAVYNAVVAIEGGYEPVDSTITAPAGASVECAVVEAAYRTLRYYFASSPPLLANLDADYGEALSNLDGLHRRRRRGHWCRPGGCRRGDLQPHDRSQPGWAHDADPCELALSDAAAGSGRVAPDAAVRRAADALGRERSTIRPAEPGPVPA
jgi:hypothetical protein